MTKKGKIKLAPLKDVHLPEENGKKDDDLVCRVEIAEGKINELEDKFKLLESPDYEKIAQQLIPDIPYISGYDDTEIRDQIDELFQKQVKQDTCLGNLVIEQQETNKLLRELIRTIANLVHIVKKLALKIDLNEKSVPNVPKPKFEGRKKLRKYIGLWMLYILKVLWYSPFVRELVKVCLILWGILCVLAFFYLWVMYRIHE